MRVSERAEELEFETLFNIPEKFLIYIQIRNKFIQRIIAEPYQDINE